MAQLRITRGGAVEALIGTQDIGGGARTVVALIASRALGWLPLDKITVKLGDSDLPKSGASAGSSTTGGVTREIEQAAQRVLGQLFDLAAEKLGVAAGQLEVKPGGVVGPRNKNGGLTWEEATGLIKDSIIGFAPTVVEPGYEWAVCRESGEIEQASREDYRA